MKKVAGVMLGMFALMIWPFGGILGAVLKPLVGGGVEQSFLYPTIYWTDSSFRIGHRMHDTDHNGNPFIEACAGKR